MSEDRITAGELREQGWPVPETVPDVASVPRSAVRMKVSSVAADPADPSRAVITLTATLDAPFEWIFIDCVLEPST